MTGFWLTQIVPPAGCHPFFADTDLPVAEADITHRQHTTIETVFSDLIDGPVAHMPSGRFGANSAWVLCAAVAHTLPRATGVLASAANAIAHGATPRRRIINIPARLAQLNADRSCTYPVTGNGHSIGLPCGATPSGTVRHYQQQADHPP